jgi:tetratricopeptide (TPR) repeat protein
MMKPGTRAVTVLVVLLALSACRKTAADYLARGNERFDKGQYGDAIIEYRQALQKEPGNQAAQLQVARAEWKQRNGTAAWDAAKLADQAGKPNAEVWKLRLEIGMTAFLQAPVPVTRLSGELHQVADRLLAQDSKSFEALRAKGYLTLTENNDREALRYFREAAAVKPADVEMAGSLLQSLYRNGRAEEARAYAEDFLTQQPAAISLYDILQRQEFAAGRNDSGLEYLKRWREKAPNQAAPYLELARHWARAKDAVREQEAIQQLLAAAQTIPDAPREAGQYELSRGRALKAAEIFGEAAKQSKQRRLYLVLQAGALAQAGKVDEAENAYTEIMAANPNDGETLVNRAVIRMATRKKEKIEQAIADLEGGLKANPKLLHARYQLGTARLRLGDATAARKEWQAVEAESPDRVDALVALARLDAEQGNAAEALKNANEAIKLRVDAGRGEALLIRGQGLLALRRLDEAEPILTAVTEQYPSFRRSADLHLALLAMALNQKDRAERILRAYAGAQQDDPRWLEAQAELLIQRNQPAEALALVKGALAREPQSVWLRRITGEVAYRTRQAPLALEQYEWLGPKLAQDIAVQMRWAELLWLNGKQDAAIERAVANTKLAPESAAPHAALGFLYQERERYAEAIGAFERAAQLNPKDARYPNNIAWNNAMLQKWDVALQSAEAARKLDPKNVDVLDTIGWIRLKSGRPDLARQMFQQILLDNPKEPLPVVRYHLAEAWLAEKAEGKADEEIRRASAAGPPPRECVEVRRRTEGRKKTG